MIVFERTNLRLRYKWPARGFHALCASREPDYRVHVIYRSKHLHPHSGESGSISEQYGEGVEHNRV
jgi:hypothetical protein